MQNRGGADLDIAAADCQHFKDVSSVIELPKKFWLAFNVPGFYHITEYDIDRISISHGKIDMIWGTSKHQKGVVYATDFGRLVFFSEEAAKAGLNKLIEERRGEVNGEM
jgi:hypothetical protein